MMKSSVILLVVTLAVVHFDASSAGTVEPSLTVGVAKQLLSEGGKISIPVSAKNVSTLRACYLTVRYQGQITTAEFVPTDYLHNPVVIPPKVDNQSGTIMIALAASNRVVTMESDGILGRLVIEGTVDPRSLRVVEADILDEHYDIYKLVEDGDVPAPDLSEEQLDPASPEIRETKLFQSHPNPANPTSTISFQLKDRSYVTLRIFNVNGQVVRTLVNEELSPKEYNIIWDTTDNKGGRVSSGIYFYRLRAGGFVDQRKLVILK